MTTQTIDTSYLCSLQGSTELRSDAELSLAKSNSILNQLQRGMVVLHTHTQMYTTVVCKVLELAFNKGGFKAPFE